LNPNVIETSPDAISEIIIGMKKGLTRETPLFSMLRCWDSNVSIPPTPEPSSTPIRFGSMTESPSPACATASREAAIAICETRSARLASLRSMYCVGSKPVTSAAIWVGNSLGSKRSIRRIPEVPP
jgi:hypothetical protein